LKKRAKENGLRVTNSGKRCEGVYALPIYQYECANCNVIFEELFLSLDVVIDDVICPACNSQAVSRYYQNASISIPKIGSQSFLSEDSEKYKEMHYHEKNRDWEKAAKAAEGVSDFAHKKFVKKIGEKSQD